MGAVRLMALIADHAAGMLGCNHLREGPRLGSVLFVAAPAEIGDVGQLGNVPRRVVRMLCQRAMARFAGDVSVLAGCPRLGFGIMTDNAGILPCVRDGPLPHHGQGAGTIVAVLSKGFGDDRAAQYQKGGQASQQNQGRPNQMTCIPYQAAHCILFSAQTKGLRAR
jgi:hypothetical protein